jgi:hypothetical protein
MLEVKDGYSARPPAVFVFLPIALFVAVGPFCLYDV